MYKKVEIKRIESEDVFVKEDVVIKEYPFTIFLNEEELVTLLCSPNSLDYLSVGFLISEGFIKNKEDIVDLKFDIDKGIVEITTKNKNKLLNKLHGKRTMTTGCGKGTIFYNVIDSMKTKKIISNLKVDPEFILNKMAELNKRSDLFLKTGGIHSCGLSDEKDILIFHEDVGRHNAIDKIIGEAFMRDINLEDKIIFTSGRISSEILLKSAKARIPIIVSRSAPTDLSVDMAKELGITLVGFARGNKMNIYSELERIFQ